MRRPYVAIALAAAIALACLTPSLSQCAMSDAVYQANKRVTEADSQLHKARLALSRSAARIRKQIEATPQYKAAEASSRAAQAQYAAAVKAVRQSLTSDASYKQAVQERNRCQAERDQLRANPDAPPDQVTQAAVALLGAQAAVARIEQQAIAADPAVSKARDALDEANAGLAEIQGTFPKYAQSDADYQSARQQVQQAAVAVNDAQKQLAQAKQQQAQADRQKMEQDIQNGRNAIMNNSGWRK